MSLAPGTRIGGYEITAALGAGAMGEVYRARDLTLKRDVALKVLQPAVADDPERLARFRREAEVLASLNHPHIAQIYGVVDRALVMELVEGDDLAQRIARGPLAVDDAVPIARQIVDALDAAHEAGVIHRDLKPANIRMRADGTVKVLDFGLAKTRTSQSEPASLATMTSPDMTVEGVILGTAAYMAPEQATGRGADRRVDIWAFGCVLFEMLTGRRAFAGATLSDTMAAVLKEPPPLELLPASTPPALVRLLRRCLEKDPAQRLRDIGDARFDLEQALAGGGDPAVAATARTTSTTWVRRVALIAAGAAIGALAVAAFVSNATSSAAVMRMAVNPAPDGPLVTTVPASVVTISADGRRVIYQVRRTDAEGSRVHALQLVSRTFDTFESAPLGDVGLYPTGAFVSPDDAWIGFETKTGPRLTQVLAKVPAAGGAMATICDLGPVGSLHGASWGTDGRIVFATDQQATGLLQVNAAGGTPETLTIPRKDQGERDHLWPERLPGNAGVLFTIARTDGTFDIAVLPANSATWRTLVRNASAARYLPGGHLGYVSSGILYGVGFDLQTLDITTERVPLVEKIAVKPSGAADIAVSSGTLAYVPVTDRRAASRLVWLNVDGTVTQLALPPGAYERPLLSPDGRRIAVENFSGQSDVDHHGRGGGTIWVYDIPRQSFTRVSPQGESGGFVSWSADGRRLAFWSSTHKGLFLMAPDGNERPVRLTEFATGIQIPYGWTPDGSRLSFVQQQTDINLFSVATTPPHAVQRLARSEGTNVEAAFSPDGRWVTHVAFDGAVTEIVVGPADAPDRRWPVASGGRFPAWGRGGREVLFQGNNAIQRVSIDPATGLPLGTMAEVVKIPQGLIGRVDATADGSRFLMLEQRGADTGPAEIRVVLNWDQELAVKMRQAKPVSR